MGSIYFYIVATAACLVVCASTSSAQTPAQPAERELPAEDSNDESRDEIKKTLAEYRGRLSQLESLVTYLLGQRNDGNHHAPLELPRQPAGNRSNQIERLVRRRREAPVSPAALMNDSEHADDEDSRSRTLHGSHWITTDGGTVYTHWGRPDCRNGSELVYTGTSAGSNAGHPGGGSNILCMPMEPIYDQTDAAHGTRSLLYSSEFETSTAPAFGELHDTTPACAVCRAPANRLTKLVIPARNECPSSKWRLEYRGYLMSSLYNTGKRTEFICMDREAKAVPGTTGNQGGAAFYMVEARCVIGGGIDCGPYVSGYELTCAVCTI